MGRSLGITLAVLFYDLRVSVCTRIFSFRFTRLKAGLCYRAHVVYNKKDFAQKTLHIEGVIGMAKYDTVIFDLDGTTLDTLEDLADSVNFALNLYGYEQRPLAHVRKSVGNGVANLVSLCIPQGHQNPQFNDCLGDFRAHYEKNLQNKTAPYAGIPELIAELHKKNYKLAIVSNKLDGAVKELNKQYFGDVIAVAIGETEHLQRKPAPDSVFAALKELGADVSKAVYVGDSEVDVKTAKNAGLPCIAVTWGFRDRELLESEGADYIIDRPEELLEILERQ